VILDDVADVGVDCFDGLTRVLAMGDEVTGDSGAAFTAGAVAASSACVMLASAVAIAIGTAALNNGAAATVGDDGMLAKLSAEAGLAYVDAEGVLVGTSMLAAIEPAKGTSSLALLSERTETGDA